MAPPSTKCSPGSLLRPSTKYFFLRESCFCYLVGDMDCWGWEKRDHNVKRGGGAYNQQHLKLLNILKSAEDPA